jgi:tetratricopeptide (TPR) repeat protein
MLGNAIATFEHAYGDDSIRVRDALDNYGLALAMTGRYDDARDALERALALGHEADFTRGALLCDLSRVALAQGDVRRAVELGEQGIAQIKGLGIEKINLAINEDPLAAAYAAGGRQADALAQSSECITEFAKSGNDGVDTVSCLAIEGAALVELGRPGDAAPVLERALRLQTGRPAAPGVLANIQYQLARALVASGGDTTRAGTLAAAARAELARYAFEQPLLARLDAWRAKALR